MKSNEHEQSFWMKIKLPWRSPLEADVLETVMLGADSSERLEPTRKSQDSRPFRSDPG